jgi:hypothetical protein
MNSTETSHKSSAASCNGDVLFGPPGPYQDGAPTTPGREGFTAEEGPDTLQGYVQVSISKEGRIAVRGSRQMFDWFLRRLAAEGWLIDLEDVHWCG